MKKIVVFAAVLVMSIAALSAKSWTNYAGFGWNLPMDLSVNVPNRSLASDMYFENQTGLETFYMGIKSNGFAVKAAFDLNGSGINETMNGENYLGVNENIQLGIGFAPLHEGNFTLAVFGMTGLDISAFYVKTTFTDTVLNETSTMEYTQGYIAWMLGGNITASYKVKKHLSVYASCSVYHLTEGLYVDKCETDSRYYADMEETNTADPTVKVIPTIGICWKF